MNRTPCAATCGKSGHYKVKMMQPILCIIRHRSGKVEYVCKQQPGLSRMGGA